MKNCSILNEVWSVNTESNEVLTFQLTGLLTELSDEYLPGVEYTFPPRTQEDHSVVDLLTQQAFILTKRLTEAPAIADQSFGLSEEVSHGNDMGMTGNSGRLDSGAYSSELEEEVPEENMEEQLTIDELVNVFNDSEDDDDNEEEEEENSGDSDSYDVEDPGAKKQRKTTPKDETSVLFGSKWIHKFELYEHGDQVIRVLEFSGKRHPARGAVCEIICSLEVTIRNTPSFSSCSLADMPNFPSDRILYQEVEKGAHFMQNLSEYNGSENFHDKVEAADFQLNVSRDKKKSNFFLQLKRLKLDPLEDTEWSQNPCELVLFAGVGGSSIGDKQAGSNISWLVEKDPLASASLRNSHQKAMIYQEDVWDCLDSCRDGKKDYPIRGEVRHMQASPPCQSFSLLNRGGRDDHANTMLSYEVVRAAGILRPPTGMMENVGGILRGRNLKHSGMLMLGLINNGYQVRVAVHNASLFGDPQKRQRVIFPFSRGDVPLPDMRNPTHDTPTKLGDALQGLSEECDMVIGTGLHSSQQKRPTTSRFVQFISFRFIWNHSNPSMHIIAFRHS